MPKYAVTIEGRTFEVEIDLLTEGDLVARVDGEQLRVSLPGQPDWLLIEDRPYEIAADRDLRRVRAGSNRHAVEVRDLESGLVRPSSSDGRIKAPIPGLVTRLLVEPGQTVEAGQPVLVLEAMKMENEIRAPRAGKVGVMHVAAGQGVLRNQVLGEIE